VLPSVPGRDGVEKHEERQTRRDCMIGELERLSGDDRGFLRGFLGVEGLKPWYGSQELEGEQPPVQKGD